MKHPAQLYISGSGSLFMRIGRAIGSGVSLVIVVCVIWTLAAWDTVILGKNAADQDEDLR